MFFVFHKIQKKYGFMTTFSENSNFIKKNVTQVEKPTNFSAHESYYL